LTTTPTATEIIRTGGPAIRVARTNQQGGIVMRGKCLWVVIVASLAVVGTLPGGQEKKPSAGDAVLKKIQGTWRFTKEAKDGKKVPTKKLAKRTITFKDDAWTVRDGDEVVQAGTHTFNPKKKPGQVDAVVTEGEGKGNTMKGIFELKGNTLKVCFDPEGKVRPKSFTAKAGQFSAVVERVAKKKKS
jgi:uncharacterized protein (TIGR03067 family)